MSKRGTKLAAPPSPKPPRRAAVPDVTVVGDCPECARRREQTRERVRRWREKQHG
jgi:hypothetical protein